MLFTDNVKVLSIDFDYFQKVSKETLMYYPDGHDFGTELSCIIWAGHYVAPDERAKIEGVKLDQAKLNKVINLLKEQNILCPVLITQSHKHIADFIKDNLPDTKTKFEVVNLDMHHDTFEYGGKSETSFENVDCGNWGSVILNNYPNSQITWVNQKASSVYGDGDKRLIIEPELDNVLNRQYDMIFICRSDIWLPPHLDAGFKKLFNCAARHFYQVRYEKGIDKPRDISLIRERIEAETNFFKTHYPEQYKKSQENNSRET